MTSDAQRWTHPWPPVTDAESRVLVLGSFPSPASRSFGFYYGHPQNCFWTVVADVLSVSPPMATLDARREFLLKHHIACWDVLHACTIVGASDASIRDPEPNRFAPLLAGSKIRRVFTNGRMATDLFSRLCTTEAGCRPIGLPSTSPANRARWTEPRFREAWVQLAEWVS